MGEVLADVFSSHEDDAFLQLKALLEPFGLSQFYPDGWGAYERNLPTALH
ncbi:MAG: transposase, partial [Cyanobacteria bacterium CAN_BIN43]|nr:transposase [Cyanobacteria bacterium CAN_BIN43]